MPAVGSFRPGSVTVMSMRLEDQKAEPTLPTSVAVPAAAAASLHSGSQLQSVLGLVATVVQEESFQGAAGSLVTRLAVELECDRVSLGLVRGRCVELCALSHTADLGRKTDLARAIAAAMEEALDQCDVVNFSEDAGDDTPGSRVTRLHAGLALAHGSGSICSIPLMGKGGVPAVLTLERDAERPFDMQAIAFAEVALQVAGPLVCLTWQDERSLLAKTGTSLRRGLARFYGPGHDAWKVAGLVAVGLVLFFSFARGAYRVPAKATLEGSIQRVAVAPFDGYVGTAHFRAGDTVTEGDVLCTLDDRELRLELLKWTSQREQLQGQHQKAMAQLEAAEVKAISARMEQAEAQRALVHYNLTRTQVLAPFSGIVVRGDLSQSVGAPVERGQVLFEIAPLDSYRVALEVDERDIAQLAEGQSGHLALAAFPAERLPFVVETITPVSSASEGRNYFRVEARLERAPRDRLRPGMEGVAKIETGRRRLLWMGTHKALDWLRLAQWSWLP